MGAVTACSPENFKHLDPQIEFYATKFPDFGNFVTFSLTFRVLFQIP